MCLGAAEGLGKSALLKIAQICATKRSAHQEEHWRDHNNVSAVGGKERWA